MVFIKNQTLRNFIHESFDAAALACLDVMCTENSKICFLFRIWEIIFECIAGFMNYLLDVAPIIDHFVTFLT